PDKALARLQPTHRPQSQGGLAYQIRSAIYKVQKKDALVKPTKPRAKEFNLQPP
ncbi:MAG: hypothetical protein IPM93_18255, partial [Candidatus Obscuribacter sp.]|nr:hypothetical protein [Candidatus Obscuribacter sp.]